MLYIAFLSGSLQFFYQHMLDNARWDTWGRSIERCTAYEPWIWTTGNHELDYAPEIVSCPLDLFRSLN